MKVRLGRQEDAERLAWLHLLAWQQAYAGLMPAEYLEGRMAELPTRILRWREWLDTAPPWVAESDEGEVIGFAGWGASRDEDAEPGATGELMTIYVLAQHWGSGAGRRLMEAALASLRREGYREATLWVLEGNGRARRFYEAGGWIADGAAKHDQREGFTLHEIRYRIRLRYRVLCATGVLGPPGESGVDEVLRHGPGLRIDGLEFLIRTSHHGRLDELLPRLQDSGMHFPVVHLRKGVAARLPDPDARAELEDNLRFAAALGAELGVLHLWDLPDSDQDFDSRLVAYRLARQLADEHGVELGIESIPCTVATPLRNLRTLLNRHPEARLVYDTEFLASHGELEAALAAEDLRGSVRHLHVKDFDGSFAEADGSRRWLGPGEGAIDFRAVSAALAERTFRGTVSLEVGPRQRPEGPDRVALEEVLRVLATDDWDFSASAVPA